MSLKNILELAREEIVSLRRRNEILEARDEVVRLFTCLIMPRTPGGMGEDVAWKITKELRRIEAEEKETKL
jgi:hypothetical protein